MSLPRHRHPDGYVAVVLAGGYIEAGDRGRLRVEAGIAIVHGAYEAHRNDFGQAGATVLNLPLPSGLAPGPRRLVDMDAIARCAERNPVEAAELLHESTAAPFAAQEDWPDRLARALSENPALSLAWWAERIGIAPQSLSRGFRQVYGVSPKRFRAEQRTLRAVEALRAGPAHLAGLAAELGFADQAHLTRAITGCTGWSPARFQVQLVQAKGRAKR